MNNLKKVYKHLNEENLSTKKIELSLVSDIETRANFIKKTLSQVDNLQTDFIFLKKQIKNIENLLKSDAKLLSKDIKNAVSKLKDLGMDGAYIKGFNKTLDKANQEIKKINSLIS